MEKCPESSPVGESLPPRLPGRFVLVPGVTDDDATLAGIAKSGAGLGNVQRVEVLPFHQLGSFKWERLGLDYTLASVEPPTAEAAEEICEIFRAEGLKAH